LLRVLCGDKVPIPVINTDTGIKFKEIYEFRNRLALEWDLNLIIELNEDALN
jgi:3'-phosphoadenosine 5'-phosphosulfate sulfotransferase (PAPS reductase)/FAD synthetase